MNTLNHISQDDLLLFALQFLPEDEMVPAHAHTLTCDDCRKQLAWIQGDLASYALTAEAQTPPVAARERLLRSIAKEKRVTATLSQNATQSKVATMAAPVLMAGTVSQELQPHRDNVVNFEDAPIVKRRMGFAGWAGWAVAAAAIVAGGLQYQKSEGFRTDLAESQAELSQVSQEAAKASMVMETLTDSHTKQVSLALPSTTAPPAVPEAHASYLGKKGSLVFVANHLAALDPAKTYELWLIPTGKGAVPIPAGTFKPDAQGRASMMMASLPKDVDVAAVGVTIEPDGGSEKPTMPIVLMGD